METQSWIAVAGVVLGIVASVLSSPIRAIVRESFKHPLRRSELHVEHGKVSVTRDSKATL